MSDTPPPLPRRRHAVLREAVDVVDYACQARARMRHARDGARGGIRRLRIVRR